MKRKKRYIARMDEVMITREADSAVIAYKEEDVPTTHLTIGPRIAGMTEDEILELFNEILRVEAQMAPDYRHVAVEVPLGSPQIEHQAQCHRWTPRGKVLRCLIDSGEDGEAVVQIDDHELSMAELGRLLATYAGWGMRIEFTPGDETHRRPSLDVREPDPE